jgi:hypothetical protein
VRFDESGMRLNPVEAHLFPTNWAWKALGPHRGRVRIVGITEFGHGIPREIKAGARPNSQSSTPRKAHADDGIHNTRNEGPGCSITYRLCFTFRNRPCFDLSGPQWPSCRGCYCTISYNPGAN